MTIHNDAENLKLRKHDKFWLDDGSIVLRAQDDLYKVHRSLLHRHSKTLASLQALNSESVGRDTVDGLEVVHIPDELGVRSGDFEALLEHLYHDAPLDVEADFARIAAVFRASSKQQLNFPTIHARARSRIEQLIPSNPEAFARAQHAEEALDLAVTYDVPSIRKALYYSVATHPHPSDVPEPQADGTVSHPELAPDISARCDVLLDQLIAHFTPILFTVATAGHMACTDVLAEKWMPLVIQTALDDNGLCRPLETLERIIAIDWEKEGLCAECVKDKREEWRGEQRDVWARMDEWLS
ncbi:hypothetical protein K466DRAFT_666465 [Polyporus arcularius HHB13444]|uniref:BTB domain-containing protein n=1 Tax=Polyporus arcularius HHB13444 TaxID=1314778 RepID=A0A5C3P2H7_9APHY|nr:hypothetical protein K466DRAFT_666465 [Polyporus arcularius HHB13444]